MKSIKFQGSKSKYEIGMDGICRNLSQETLAEASPLWKQNRTSNEVMRLFDMPELADVQDDDFTEIIADKSQRVIVEAPSKSHLKQQLAACDRIFKIFINKFQEKFAPNWVLLTISLSR